MSRTSCLVQWVMDLLSEKYRLLDLNTSANVFLSDTAAINKAIAYQNNCGSGCMSSSVKGTLIYFPPGTYLISTPIEAYYYTQIVGDVSFQALLTPFLN